MSKAGRMRMPHHECGSQSTTLWVSSLHPPLPRIQGWTSGLKAKPLDPLSHLTGCIPIFTDENRLQVKVQVTGLLLLILFK